MKQQKVRKPHPPAYFDEIAGLADAQSRVPPAPWISPEKLVQSPFQWCLTGEFTMRAARILWRRFQEVAAKVFGKLVGPVRAVDVSGDDVDIQIIGVCMMLSGMALETLVKGLMLAKGVPGTPKVERGRLTWPGICQGWHYLPQLFEVAGLLDSNEPQEIQLLIALTEYVRYAGRYPFPTQVDQARFMKQPVPGVLAGIPQRIEALFERIRAAWPAQARPPAGS